MAKRVYFESVKSWAIKLGITGGTIIGLILTYLFLIGAISNVSYSRDVVCAGTIEDPCYAFINFTANEDIFIYPTNYDPWGRNTLFNFDPNVKSWKLERSWGSGWRTIKLDETCQFTWCGAPYNNMDDNKYAYAFREDRDYSLRITAYKNNPYEDIKWGAFSGVDEIDPIWFGIKTKSGLSIIHKDLELVKHDGIQEQYFETTKKDLGKGDIELCLIPKAKLETTDKIYKDLVAYSYKEDLLVDSINKYDFNVSTYETLGGISSICKIVNVDDVDKFQFGTGSTIYQDVNLINYNLGFADINITLSCEGVPENDIYVFESGKFGANGSFDGLRNCTYLVESTIELERDNNIFYVNEFINKDNNLENYKYHKFSFNDVCSRNFECYESYTIEGVICNISADCKYNQYEDKNYFLNVTFLSDKYIDPAITITNVSGYPSTEVNVSKEGYPYAHVSTFNDSLVLYLPFDVDNNSQALTYDYTDNHNNGVISKGSYASGYIGGGYHLDTATSDIVTIPDSNSLDIATKGTWSLWIKQDVYVGGAGVIGKYVTSTGLRSWLFIVSGGNEIQSFFSADGSTYESDISGNDCGSTFADDGTWIHLTWVYNTTNLIYYKNGAYCDIDAIAINSIHASTTNVLLGKDYWGNYFNGTMDEIMIFNRALNSTEIQAIYDNQSERFSQPATQTFNFTSMSQDGSLDRLNVTTNSSQPVGTNLSLRVQKYDASNVSIGNTSWYNIANGTNQLVTTTIDTSTYYVRLEFNYSTDEYKFYTPILFDDVLLNSWEAVAEDTCTCAGLDTNWEIDLSDYCVISTNCDLGTGNITWTGTGNITFNATIEALNIDGLPANERGFVGSVLKFIIGSFIEALL